MTQRSKLGLNFFSPAFSTPCLSSGPVNRSDAWHITVALPAQRGCAQTISANVLKQPRRRLQQKPHKFAYLTMKNSIFARFARALFIFWHFVDVFVLSTTWNDLFCSCVDNVSIWWQMLIFVFLCPKRWFQFNSRIVRTHFSSIMTLNIWKMIAEKREVTFSDDVLASVDVVFA